MSENHIPTMPQSDHIPTMPQSEHIPTMPQSDHIPTMPQNGGHIPTMPQDSADGRVKTIPQNGNVHNSVSPQGRRPVITSDVRFIGECGGSYTIHANEKVNDDSGESQIFFCDMEGRIEKYVARILISVRPTSTEKIETRNKVIRFLIQKSQDIKSHILPLIDYATVRLSDGEYFIEIYPFCEGGDLSTRKGKISYSELKEKIIPSLNTALNTFHKAGFVHRDVKPDNLYYYKGELVLGDFGITCDLRDDGFATDRTKTGTLGYYAPELMSQAALVASDYYSFGQTIWTLYSGEMMYQSIVRVYKSKGVEELRNKINKAMLDNEYFGLDEIKPEEDFFEILVRGLLQYDPSSRFGHEEVKRWLADDKSVAHNIPKYNSQSIYRNPFIYNGKECWDNDEVFTVLASNWEYAKQALYTGGLKNFFATIDFSLSTKIDEIVRFYSRASAQYSAELQHDIGLALFLLHLNNYKKMAWQGIVFNNLFDLSEVINNSVFEQSSHHNEKTTTSFFHMLSTDLVRMWYEKLQEKSQSKVDDGILKAIEEIKRNSNSNQYTIDMYRFEQNVNKFNWSNSYAVNLAYFLFTSDVNNIEIDNCTDIEQIARKIVEHQESASWYLNFLIENPAFCAFLYRLGYGEHLHNIIRESIDTHSRAENMFDFIFTKINDDKLKADFLQCYLNYGPDSYLVWTQRNVDLYCFNGNRANEVLKEIKDVSFNADSINSIREGNNKLKMAIGKLREMFVDNAFLTVVGLLGNKFEDGITSKHLKAYWHAEFLGKEVPIGFIYDLEKKGVATNE